MAREDKQALYLLGERLIKARKPVMLIVGLVTAFFAWRATNLELITSFGDPVSYTHLRAHET